MLPGCSSGVVEDGAGGGGDDAGDAGAFTLANSTVSLPLGPAGVFPIEGMKTTTNVADVVPFPERPDDSPVTAVVRILPEKIKLDAFSVSGKLGRQMVDGVTVTGSFNVDVWVDQHGAADPCDSGTHIGGWFLDVVDNEVVGVKIGSHIQGRALQVFLDNGFSMCLRTNIDTVGDPDVTDPSQIRGTIELQGLELTFGPHRDVGIVDVPEADRPTPGTTQACCWPPLSVYYEFNEPRVQLCEDLGMDERFGTPRQQCERGGGVWKGPGSSCDSLTCDEPFRVCCLQPNEPSVHLKCTEYPEEYCLTADIGVPTALFPEDVTCDDRPDPCGEPTTPCCYPDGSCRNIPLALFDGCPDGGRPQGEGTVCEDISCPFIPEPPDIRACCMPDGTCRDVGPATCDVVGGTPQGEGGSCAELTCPVFGACCELDATCVLRTEEECFLLSRDAPHTYLGDNTACIPNRCEKPTGACCDRDGNCTDEEEETCVENGGFYQGHATSCNNAFCQEVVGACCDGAGGCIELTESQCNDRFGSYLGDDTQCATSVCPDPLGACCFNNACTTASAQDCAALPGTYHGDGSSCDSVSCAPPPEYLVWYTANVCCWSAPWVFISDRAEFEREEMRCNFAGGGLCPNDPAVKRELQGGFATVEAAVAWLCPQITSRFNHRWCGNIYVQMNGQNWKIAGGRCDLSELPFIGVEELPEATSCE